mgnify:CR=1 FL=1
MIKKIKKITNMDYIKKFNDFPINESKNNWDDLYAALIKWCEENKSSTRKDANFPSWSKQKKYLYSIANDYGFDASLIKKLTNRYDELHRQTYRSSRYWLPEYEDWMRKKLE